MQPYIGEIRIFAGSFAPAGWAFCNGDLLPISENDALFNLIGTTYGGDGENTFGVPDLRGRLPLHMGSGPGLLGNYIIGEAQGVESITLSTNQIPSHNHTVQGSVGIPVRGDSSGSLASPVNNAIGITTAKKFFTKTQGSGQMAPFTLTNLTIANAGGAQPHYNLQPYLCLNFIISLYGVYPSQT